MSSPDIASTLHDFIQVLHLKTTNNFLRLLTSMVTKSGIPLHHFDREVFYRCLTSWTTHQTFYEFQADGNDCECGKKNIIYITVLLSRHSGSVINIGSCCIKKINRFVEASPETHKQIINWVNDLFNQVGIANDMAKIMASNHLSQKLNQYLYDRDLLSAPTYRFIESLYANHQPKEEYIAKIKHQLLACIKANQMFIDFDHLLQSQVIGQPTYDAYLTNQDRFFTNHRSTLEPLLKKAQLPLHEKKLYTDHDFAHLEMTRQLSPHIKPLLLHRGVISQVTANQCSTYEPTDYLPEHHMIVTSADRKEYDALDRFADPSFSERKRRGQTVEDFRLEVERLRLPTAISTDYADFCQLTDEDKFLCSVFLSGHVTSIPKRVSRQTLEDIGRQLKIQQPVLVNWYRSFLLGAVTFEVVMSESRVQVYEPGSQIPVLYTTLFDDRIMVDKYTNKTYLQLYLNSNSWHMKKYRAGQLSGKSYADFCQYVELKDQHRNQTIFFVDEEGTFQARLHQGILDQLQKS